MREPARRAFETATSHLDVASVKQSCDQDFLLATGEGHRIQGPELQDHLRNLVRYAPHIPWVCDAQFKPLLVHQHWQELTGLLYSQLGGQNAVHLDDRDLLNDATSGGMRGGQIDVRIRLRRTDGEFRWMRLQAVAHRNKAGEIMAWYGCSDDIHEQVLAEQALRESEEHYRYSVELNPQIPWTATPDGRVDQVSPRWEAITGQTGLMAMKEAMHPDDVQGTRIAWRGSTGTKLPFDHNYRIRNREGVFRWHRSRASARLDAEGAVIRWYGTIEDVHDSVVAKEALRDSEERFRLAAQATCLGIWDYDPVSDTHSCSAELKDIFGIPECQSMSFQQALSLINAEDRAANEDQLRSLFSPGGLQSLASTMRFQRLADGAERWVVIKGWKAFNSEGLLHRVIVTVGDVTEEKVAQERIRWTATHDGLTGLPNRAMFQQELETSLARARAEKRSCALLLVDVDHFKQVNDTLGHDAGDMLLRTFAVRLRSALRRGDVVARLGGDEFAVILQLDEECQQLPAATASILSRLREPFVYDDRAVACKATLGVSIFPRHADEASELMKDADIALYAAKAAGRDRSMVYSSAMRAEMQRDSTMISIARKALGENCIIPFYQPKIDLETGRVAGFEALLRWNHPGEQPQLPENISAAFGDTDLANAISDRIFEQALADLRTWLDRGLEFGHVAVNVSAVDFRKDDLAERILGRLEAAQVPASRLEIEVTETVFLGQGSEHVGRALRRLSNAGVRIALDDFGTGYASLSHLREFPVDVLKIDRSFVAGLGQDEGSAAIVDAIINLGRSLKIVVVGEGIETAEQLRLLVRNGCKFGQGFLFSAAMPASEIPNFLGIRAAQRPWPTFARTKVTRYEHVTAA